MRKYSLILLVCFEVMIPAKAQIKGVLMDNEDHPVEAANIVLQTPDSAFITGTISNVTGVFELNATGKLHLSDYLLTVSCVGYETHTIRLKGVQEHLDLGKIILQNTMLGEVTVTAARSVVQPDRQLIFPSRQTVNTSVSGFELLNKLMLPGLAVDMVNHSIAKIGGGNVLVYINDKKATQADIIALRPDEVLRLEYIDAPGVRYANEDAEAVINFVVKQRISGMVTGINTTNAITTGNGNNFFYWKYNHKLSEFGVNYSMNYGAMSERYIDQYDLYIMPDGSEHTIDRNGINTYLKYTEQRVQLTYNLSVPQKYVFEANLRGTFYDSPNRGHKQLVEETGKTNYYTLTEPTEKYHSPVLDLFYRIELPKKQRLTVNFVGTLIDTEYGYSYKEFETDAFIDPEKKYGYNTDGLKRSFISEVRYNKQFETVSFAAGINHLQGYTKNVYTGTDDVQNKMYNANTYLYTQLQGKLNKLNYIAGVGTSRQYYRQENENYTYWLFRPSLSLSYPLFRDATLRYRFYISPRIPSLSALSDVRQQANDLEFRQGNPNLKPYWDMTNMLFFSYQHRRFYIENTTGYTYSRNTIMEEINRITDSSGNTFFEYGYDNQRNLNQFWNYSAGQYYIIPEKLTLQGGFSFMRYFSKGNAYIHTYNRYWGMLQMNLSLGKWDIGSSWNSRENFFSGETIIYRSDIPF